LFVLPPVLRGHAAAGDDPGLAVGVGVLVGEALGRDVAVAMGEAEGVVVGESEREADVLGVGVGDAPASG